MKRALNAIAPTTPMTIAPIAAAAPPRAMACQTKRRSVDVMPHERDADEDRPREPRRDREPQEHPSVSEVRALRRVEEGRASRSVDQERAGRPQEVGDRPVGDDAGRRDVETEGPGRTGKVERRVDERRRQERQQGEHDDDDDRGEADGDADERGWTGDRRLERPRPGVRGRHGRIVPQGLRAGPPTGSPGGATRRACAPGRTSRRSSGRSAAAGRACAPPHRVGPGTSAGPATGPPRCRRSRPA